MLCLGNKTSPALLPGGAAILRGQAPRSYRHWRWPSLGDSPGSFPSLPAEGEPGSAERGASCPEPPNPCGSGVGRSPGPPAPGLPPACCPSGRVQGGAGAPLLIFCSSGELETCPRCPRFPRWVVQGSPAHSPALSRRRRGAVLEPEFLQEGWSWQPTNQPGCRTWGLLWHQVGWTGQSTRAGADGIFSLSLVVGTPKIKKKKICLALCCEPRETAALPQSQVQTRAADTVLAATPATPVQAFPWRWRRRGNNGR